jgi:hypothetical protein
MASLTRFYQQPPQAQVVPPPVEVTSVEQLLGLSEEAFLAMVDSPTGHAQRLSELSDADFAREIATPAGRGLLGE